MSPSEFHSSRKFADTSFGRIAYIERGSGPTTLFLPGEHPRLMACYFRSSGTQ